MAAHATSPVRPEDQEPLDSGKPFDMGQAGVGQPSLASSRSGHIPVELRDLQRSHPTSSATSAFGGGSNPGTPPWGLADDASKRRRHDSGAAHAMASRAIKRKRFDDEIIDQPPSHPTTPVPPVMVTPPPPPIVSSAGHLLSTVVSAVASPSGSSPAFLSEAAKADLGSGQGKGKSASGKIQASLELDSSLLTSQRTLRKKAHKTKKKKREGAWKDLSRWKPTDDLALITGVLQTNDLQTVYRGTKFTCHFTLFEVQERWNALLYDPIISKLAGQAIKNLHPEVVLSVQRKTLFSQPETALLKQIEANKNPQPTLKDFEGLLAKNTQIFHHTRTPRCLAHYWQSLKQFTLLPDQQVQPLPKDNHILNFLDAEANINDGELYELKEEPLDQELRSADRRVKKEIRHLEAEINKWQMLVDKVRGDNPPDFDNQTLAVLRGRLVRYLMRSKEITLGRSSKDQSVDVDLKLEGPAWKISRKQGVIKLKTTGEFCIANEGRRSIFVNGKPVQRGESARLCNNSVLEIAGLRFVFLINVDLIDAIRQETCKSNQLNANQ
eukprot:snap_masked-scaffold447_size167621-processed-gene-0.1 protein:Tk02116 transcript:snap_masked-scaffold447_size167621-processed-gene-0.1-mRNA-1 annotation:"microspherule protein 1-like"